METNIFPLKMYNTRVTNKRKVLDIAFIINNILQFISGETIKCEMNLNSIKRNIIQKL